PWLVRSSSDGMYFSPVLGDRVRVRSPTISVPGRAWPRRPPKGPGPPRVYTRGMRLRRMTAAPSAVAGTLLVTIIVRAGGLPLYLGLVLAVSLLGGYVIGRWW